MVSTFLFIDDEPDMVSAYSRYLQKHGHTVLHAEDAQEGLDYLDENEDIGAVVLDVFMPENNGLTVLQYLQSYADWQELPVIMMTNVRREEFKLDDMQLNEHGVTEYIEKSQITPEQLRRTLEQLAL